MTGFGDASTEEDNLHLALELRSLNNRYFKAVIRLPEAIAGLEAELESKLRKRVHRGSFTMTVKLRIGGEAAVSRVNDGALQSYLEHLETLHARVPDQSVRIDLTALLMLPGVMEPSDDESVLMSKSRSVLFKLLDEAIERMDKMRLVEGEALAADLLKQRDVIAEHIDIVKARAPKVIDEYHQRLRNRIDELMARAELKVDEHDLIREVAVFADRADISEETARIAGHLEQFAQVIQRHNEEPAGRTLDFLAQEMLREANTMASKSNDTDISRAVVVVKSAIDRIKEQAQNVE